MIKVIFLDVDGVLNSLNYLLHLRKKYSREYIVKNHLRDLDPKAIKLLSKLCNKTGANIVLSSTWRYSDNLITKLQIVFDNYNMKIIDIIDKNENSKEIAINSYLNHHYINRYIIIDDEPMKRVNNLVKTKYKKGFTKKEYRKAKRLLGKEGK